MDKLQLYCSERMMFQTSLKRKLWKLVYLSMFLVLVFQKNMLAVPDDARVYKSVLFLFDSIVLSIWCVWKKNRLYEWWYLVA